MVPDQSQSQPPAWDAGHLAPPKIIDRLLQDSPSSPAVGPVNRPPKSRLRVPKSGASNTPDPEPAHSPAPLPAAQPEPLDTAPESSDAPSVNLSQPSRSRWLVVTIALLVILNVTLIFLIVPLFWRHKVHPQSDPPYPPAAGIDSTERDTTDASGRLSREAPALYPEPIDRFAIPRIELVRHVSGFGQFDRLPDIPILPRHVPHIYVYTELVNPRPETRTDERKVYQLTKRIVLYREDIGRSEPLMDTSVSLIERGLSPRRDFYSSYPLQPTRRIDPGEYRVWVRLTDQVSGQTAEKETTFTVHPPPPPREPGS